MSGGPVQYPADHQLGMQVPTGGSDCAKCEYVDGQNCKNEIFQKWNGSPTIPAPTDEYCCDLFETEDDKEPDNDADDQADGFKTSPLRVLGAKMRPRGY